MCFCAVRNSSGVSIALVSLFCICGSVVIPHVYSLSRYYWDFVFALSVRLVYDMLILHIFSSGIFFDGECTVRHGGMYFVFCFQ